MKNSNLRSQLLRWAPPVGWMALIFVLSSDSHSNAATKEVFGSANFYARKCAHMSEYGILFFLVQSALRSSEKTEKLSSVERAGSEQDGAWFPLRYVVALLTAILYACTDEWHQSFVPGRSAEIKDVVIDSSGAMIAFCIMSATSYIKAQQQQKARMPIRESPQDQ